MPLRKAENSATGWFTCHRTETPKLKNNIRKAQSKLRGNCELFKQKTGLDT
jgi:hypothetical protein